MCHTNTLIEGTLLALLLILLFALSRALSLFCFEQKLFISFSHTYPFCNATETSAIIPTNIFMTTHISQLVQHSSKQLKVAS